ncbi:hypothetical protein QR98_0097670 [Sarcoptes scabiei]|uniref:Uncharacterized protein n=1 Tax=Sarcoptes scabiei TaxID=52283 RepID=A0A132AJU8_SARSC|nr:hypothetical protein QR98_0097670 [Sarcoptes scabiei]
MEPNNIAFASLESETLSDCYDDSIEFFDTSSSCSDDKIKFNHSFGLAETDNYYSSSLSNEIDNEEEFSIPFVTCSEADGYEEEFQQLCKIITERIENQFGILIDEPKLDYEEFRKLFHIFDGNLEKIERYIRIDFKPNIIVVQNNLNIDEKNKISSNLIHKEESQSLRLMNEEIFIYPNKLSVEKKLNPFK